ncbi:MAG: transcription-repair coupling factor [Methylococcaceae bacterium]
MNSPVLQICTLPLPEPKQSLQWNGLYGSADALALASAVQSADGLLVVVMNDNHAALRLERELAFFLQNKAPVLHFPDWEILPYDVFSPLPEIVSDRVKTLTQLSAVKQAILVVSVSTLMHRLAPRKYILANSFSLEIGQNFNLDINRKKLESVGYQYAPQVLQHGEFAIRGSILDLFPMGGQTPFRIELFDDEVESIRTFDPETQRSLEKISQINLFPAREFPISETSIKQFRQAFRGLFPDAPVNNPLYQDVSKGIVPGGIEYYMPLFVDETETLFDYLPETTTMVLLTDTKTSSQNFLNEVGERYHQRQFDKMRPLLKPDTLFLDEEGFDARIKAFATVIVQSPETGLQDNNGFFNALPDLTIDPRLASPAEGLQQFISQSTKKVLFVAETAGHREALLQQLKQYQINPVPVEDWLAFLTSEQPVNITIGPMDQGLWLDNPAIAVITESQLTKNKVQQRRRRRKTSRYELENIVGNLQDLLVGDPVVHQEHGVGRYMGLQHLNISGVEAEFLTLEYANQDKIYVPVSSLHLIGRYTGVSPENAPLHKLGSDQWTKAKKRAIEKVYDVATELLDVNAKREAHKGFAFSLDEDEYDKFASTFPFEETPDQQTSIDQIIGDMTSGQPMDRVICGDVGFGKTEVAMRAAFIAVLGGKQAAVLVPTTLLAQQHYQNFLDRFAEWPIKIEVMSRFVSQKKQKAINKNLQEGKVDIVIGTHKLLSKEIGYKSLGLIIIDEEHRFGVRQKEHFKKLRSEVDLLTMTATPIPRTLNMAMSGLRDISIIASPPPNRHAINTFVSEWVDVLVQEACDREIKRGGQVFFLHNEVKTMEKIARDLEQLVPHARIEIAHGQMPEKELERVMLDFYHHRFNLLLCSTIIESGIDIPSANTIIINRADKLGLAQLHQLRGRVGRSHHRAYAYLLIPPKPIMTRDAVKRLEAIETSSELGAGFLLSSHDLEIRGAGELLGEEQSGQIQEIGFTLYTELLERAVNALKSGNQPELETPLDTGPEIDLQCSALITEDYLPDIHTRLVLYKRIANAEDMEGLRELQIEMIDRFGLLPPATKNLFSITELKCTAARLGIHKIDLHAKGGRIMFGPKPQINADQLISLIQTQPAIYQLDGTDKLKIAHGTESVEERLSFLTPLLDRLAVSAEQV